MRPPTSNFRRSMSNTREGNHGGYDLLDIEDRLVVDKEVEEAREPLNLRQADNFDTALADVTKTAPGGYVRHRQFQIDYSDSRPTDLTFDRFYWEHKLLVDFLVKPANAELGVTLDKSIEEKRAFAKTRGYKYLPIVGSATAGDIKQALA